MTRIAVTGAAGRMGKALVEAVMLAEGAELTAAIVLPDSSLVGANAGELAGIGAHGVVVVGNLTEVVDQFDVLIDFTSPAATLANAEFCARNGKQLVVGTTGFTDAEKAQMLSAADQTALCVAFPPSHDIANRPWLRMRDKGVKPVRGGAMGDLLCRVMVETPVNLSAEQQDLLRKFQTTLDNDGGRQSPKKSSWFAGVKSFFDDMKL